MSAMGGKLRTWKTERQALPALHQDAWSGMSPGFVAAKSATASAIVTITRTNVADVRHPVTGPWSS
jgi:hypothetical protein